MASTYLPSWIHAPTLAHAHALWNRPVSLGSALLSGLGLYVLGFLVSDIYAYYLLVPQDMRGTISSQPAIYILSGLIRSFRWLTGKDGTSTRGLRRFVAKSKERQPIYGRRFLKDGDVPVRRGPRASILVQGLPHRQIPQLLDEELEKELKARFDTFGASHSLTSGESHIEPNALALFLPHTPPSLSQHPELQIPPSRKASSYEFAHIHGGESSMHLFLAPLDAAEAIEKGWAVRFPLAGGLGEWGRAQGRVLVYAPRDRGEVGVVMRLVEAGWEYLSAVPKA
ncbi:hypothetical protein CALCODRAFT_501422 [Calocera cornea HHB12733]|uniref:Luciferase domain-containing protein n=1 Tax=Calocera cornea HHB12733 TaxID=1353952 RepID=A0A165DMM3_9BASI|nr:hypothetical protein CALCODRAFT_501422 [Calocera cornea HHB12733]